MAGFTCTVRLEDVSSFTRIASAIRRQIFVVGTCIVLAAFTEPILIQVALFIGLILTVSTIVAYWRGLRTFPRRLTIDPSGIDIYTPFQHTSCDLTDYGWFVGDTRQDFAGVHLVRQQAVILVPGPLVVAVGDDIKPCSEMLTRSGAVRLADAGARAENLPWLVALLVMWLVIAIALATAVGIATLLVGVVFWTTIASCLPCLAVAYISLTVGAGHAFLMVRRLSSSLAQCAAVSLLCSMGVFLFCLLLPVSFGTRMIFVTVFGVTWNVSFVVFVHIFTPQSCDRDYGA